MSKDEFGNGTTYSVQQMVSCATSKSSNGCFGSTVDFAWNKLNQANKNQAG